MFRAESIDLPELDLVVRAPRRARLAPRRAGSRVLPRDSRATVIPDIERPPASPSVQKPLQMGVLACS